MRLPSLLATISGVLLNSDPPPHHHHQKNSARDNEATDPKSAIYFNENFDKAIIQT